jgi:hypothetical protein
MIDGAKNVAFDDVLPGELIDWRGFATFVFERANSSRIVIGESGSKRTPWRFRIASSVSCRLAKVTNPMGVLIGFVIPFVPALLVIDEEDAFNCEDS